MNSISGLALLIVAMTTTAIAGDVGVYVGAGHRSGEGAFMSEPLYQAGATLRHFEIRKDRLWPELELGAWASKEDTPARFGYRAEETDYWGLVGRYVGVRLVYALRKFEEGAHPGIYPQIGFGLAYHQSWILDYSEAPANAEYGRLSHEDHVVDNQIVVRLDIPTRNRNGAFVEGLINPRFGGIITLHHQHYLLKAGYRFRAF